MMVEKNILDDMPIEEREKSPLDANEQAFLIAAERIKESLKS